MSVDTIARLKISLDDAKPAVLRRVEVPFDIRLDRLHLTIQAAMGWTNSHLYEIRAGNVGWSTPDPDADWASDFIDARKARLGDILEDIGTKTLAYLYDFGDGWAHTIKIEASRRSRARRALPAPDRGQRSLPSRRLRRPLGLCRTPRGHQGSQARKRDEARAREKKRPCKSPLAAKNSQASPISIGRRKIIFVAFQLSGFLHSLGHERLGGASCRFSHVRNAPLATVGPKKAACRDGPILLWKSPVSLVRIA